jgi:predicted metalloprotease with PDZ domain/ribosomal protein L40E
MMQTEQTRSQQQTDTAQTAAVTVCPKCGAQMPAEMRFCRACGFRLGEGVAEFTETVRFDKSPTGAAQARATGGAKAATTATAATPKWQSCGMPQDWGAVAKKVSDSSVKLAAKFAEQQQKQLRKQQRKQQQKLAQPPRHRSHWKFWLILIIIITVIGSGGFRGASGWRGLRDRLRGLSSASSSGRSWVGTSNFKATANGVTFDQVEPAGSPADKAGLVGGDVVTTFDGKPVKEPSEFMNLLTATPIGKTVEVVYLRDGETRTTKLTTVSEDDLEKIEETAGDAPQGFVGIGGSSERVQLPGTNISGIQLNSIRRNNPGYIAGMRDGDIVIEFDGVPIRTYDELESRTRRAVPDSTVKVVVMRAGQRIEIPVKVGED